MPRRPKNKARVKFSGVKGFATSEFPMRIYNFKKMQFYDNDAKKFGSIIFRRK